MQILKDEIRNAVLKEALEEFYEKGYESSSLRRIASSAGTTAGNLYRYFSSKLDLFATVVEPAFRALMEYSIRHYQNHDAVTVENLPELLEEEIEHFSAIIAQYRREIYILFKKSSGTPYNEKAALFLKGMKEHSLEHIGEADIPDLTPHLKALLADAMIKAYMEGWLNIINTDITREEMTALAREYLKLFLLGPLAAFQKALT